MQIQLEIGKQVRCDIITYSGADFGGKREFVRIFPTGSVQGGLESEQVTSMLIQAHLGTRIILCTRTGDLWEQGAWRCVRMLKGHCLSGASPTDLPGVRLPNIDLLDPPGARRTNPDLESSYPLVSHFDEGEGWTFGTVGAHPLAGQVRRIIIEKDTGPRTRPLAAAERVARAILQEANTLAPEAVPALLQAAEAELANEEAAALRQWLEQL